MSEEIRLGIDVGGTFTDLVILRSDGTAIPKKVLSSPPDFSTAIKAGLLETLQESGVDASQVREYTHGATVATNAIITRTGAVTGLITTQGFRDVLELRRMRMHKLYDINWEKPPPLVPRHLRIEVPARMTPQGAEETPLDEEAARQAIQRLIDEGVGSLAICYINAYANGAHERRTQELALELAPTVRVSCSSEVLPEIREYERSSTTVINAYVQPIVDAYFQSMETDLKEMGVVAPVMVMQSNGGMIPSETARRLPIHVIESGPAAGVTGAYHLAQRMGIDNVITLDMGGTTAKAAMIEDGEISRSPEYEVGGELSIGHRLMKGSGYLLRVPSIDIAEVGAGGGSVAWADEAGALKVGPHSAGARPGPACYGLGGAEPTITDANVHMGLTNPEYLAGGALKLYPELADKAIEDRLASRLGIDVTTTAWGIRAVANSSLIRALRAVSTERGRDPRRFTLLAFGGMGPVHALDLAAELGITRVVVPPLPGLFSALGLLLADVEHHLIQTHYTDTDKLDYDGLHAVIDKLMNEAVSMLDREGYDAAHRSIALSADTRYVGQDFSLTIPLPGPKLDPKSLAPFIEEFHQEHSKTYGYDSREEEVQIVALRCVARGLPDRPRVPEQLEIASVKGWKLSPSRRCYFGPEWSWIQTPVMTRHDLLATPVEGPAIIEEDNSLTVVTPNWKAGLDEWSNIILEPK
jgi:N-methylhydantoinase A